MSLKFCSFSSDSSGNSCAVWSDETLVLIDVGISGKKITDSLESLEFTVEDINAILLTHEHIDHVKSVKVMSKKRGDFPFYASQGTQDNMQDTEELKDKDRIKLVKAGQPFQIGDLTVEPFNLSHDAAEPIGYAITHEGKKFVMVTDTGCITEEIMNHIVKADFLVIEANHEVNILKMSEYPYEIKRRILGDEGHLSNELTGKCICDFLSGGVFEERPKVLLAHISQKNNTPKHAYLTIRNIIEEAGFREYKDLEMDILKKDKLSKIYHI